MRLRALDASSRPRLTRSAPVSQSVSYFTVPPRAHPSTGSQSGSATPGRTQVPSTRSRGQFRARSLMLRARSKSFSSITRARQCPHTNHLTTCGHGKTREERGVLRDVYAPQTGAADLEEATPREPDPPPSRSQSSPRLLKGGEGGGDEGLRSRACGATFPRSPGAAAGTPLSCSGAEHPLNRCWVLAHIPSVAPYPHITAM